MKTISLLLNLTIIAITSISYAQNSNNYIGKYEGIIPSYETMVNDQVIQVAESPITIILEEDYIIYECSGNKLTGNYKIVKSKKTHKEVNALVTNGRSIKLDLAITLFLDENKMQIGEDSDRPTIYLKKAK